MKFLLVMVRQTAEREVVNPPCPWLPTTDERGENPDMHRSHETASGANDYRKALRHAQSKWRAGKPAQAILQLNKAWAVDLSPDDPVLALHPPPYAALEWILRASAQGDAGFLGNPVRHFQHLASRVTGPRRQARSWRAWCCYHLSRRVLPPTGFDPDGRQLAREGLWIPCPSHALVGLSRSGWRNEHLHASPWIVDHKSVNRLIFY